MVKFLGGFHSDEARGTFNKNMYFQRHGRGGIKSRPKQPNTSAQKFVRYWNYQGSNSYKVVFDDQKLGWDLFGKRKSLPGYHSFLSMYLKRVLIYQIPYRDTGDTDPLIIQFTEATFGVLQFKDVYQVPYYKDV